MKPAPDGSGEGLPVHGDAVEDPPQDEALGEGGDEAPEAEGEAPEGGALGVVAKLEGHPAEDEPEEHDDERDVKGGKGDAVEEGEGPEEHPAQDHEPGLVILPHALEACHHDAPLPFIPGEEGDHAHAQVEAVGDGIVEDEKTDDQEPDFGNVRVKPCHYRPSFPEPPCPPAVSACGRSGPRAMMRRAKRKKRIARSA